MSVDTLERVEPMGRKKGTGSKKTVMVRAYESFAELVIQAAAERRMTMADFCEKFLTPCVEAAHRDYIRSEAERLGPDHKKGKG